VLLTATLTVDRASVGLPCRCTRDSGTRTGPDAARSDCCCAASASRTEDGRGEGHDEGNVNKDQTEGGRTWPRRYGHVYLRVAAGLNTRRGAPTAVVAECWNWPTVRQGAVLLRHLGICFWVFCTRNCTIGRAAVAARHPPLLGGWSPTATGAAQTRSGRGDGRGGTTPRVYGVTPRPGDGQVSCALRYILHLTVSSSATGDDRGWPWLSVLTHRCVNPGHRLPVAALVSATFRPHGVATVSRGTVRGEVAHGNAAE